MAPGPEARDLYVEPARVGTAPLDLAPPDHPVPDIGRRSISGTTQAVWQRGWWPLRHEPADGTRSPSSFTTRSTVSPMSAGLRTTRCPSASIASSLAVAVSLSPLITAPACPIRRSRGADTPA